MAHGRSLFISRLRSEYSLYHASRRSVGGSVARFRSSNIGFPSRFFSAESSTSPRKDSAGLNPVVMSKPGNAPKSTSAQSPKVRDIPKTAGGDQPSTGSATLPSSKPPKKSLWTRVKEEAEHYWLGTKLLAKEISISTRLLYKVGSGGRLTRREHNQLVRTGGDLFRLVPFSVFLLVPFMELLLPVALRLFPNMLPSTYTSKEKEEAKTRQIMATKLQMAKFLRDSIAESGIHSKSSPVTKAQEFAAFFKKYRTSGERASTEEVMEICRRFSDNLTLDNLSRPQLVTLCRFMGVNALGTDNYLRWVLHSRLDGIERDDKMILAEGVDSLTLQELQSACQTRGIRTIDVHTARLRFELQQWIDLHTTSDIPSTLLILSRALMMTDKPLPAPADPTEALQNTLKSLPNEVVEEAELRLSESEGQKVSYKKKLEIVTKEEARIAAENEASKKEEEESTVDTSEPLVIETVVGPHSPASEKESLTKTQFRELSDALDILTNSKDVEKEKTELEQLKLDRQKFIEEHADQESKTKTKQLKELDDFIAEIESYVKRIEETSLDSSSTISADMQGNLTLDQLESALRQIRHKPSEERIKFIVQSLDVDNDGKISLKELKALAEERGESEGVGTTISSLK